MDDGSGKVVGLISRDHAGMRSWIESDEGVEWKRKQDQAAGCFGFGMLVAGFITGCLAAAIIFGIGKC